MKQARDSRIPSTNINYENPVETDVDRISKFIHKEKYLQVTDVINSNLEF